MREEHTMMRNITHWILIVAGYLLMSGYNACDPIIENNGFDLWCGENLCSWQTEVGTIERVPTWHGNDDGVSFTANHTAISQFSDISSGNAWCLRFDLVAKIDETAQVTLELDFYDDGTVDWSRQIPTSDWAPLNYLITMPERYQGVRFRLRKLGSGKAVIAQIQADTADKCVTPPETAGPRPLGAGCSTGTDCASDLCVEPGIWDTGVCGECTEDSDCDTGEVCGAETPAGGGHLAVYRGCGPAARRHLGERCLGDAECDTGLCGTSGLCETCAANTDCPDGETCMRLGFPGLYGPVQWQAPLQCSPNGGLRASGEACLIDSDCATPTCVGDGILRVCSIDGRTCANDQDCPSETECVAVGTVAGQCQ